MRFDSVTIYTKPNCSYCVRAKQLLEMTNIPYTERRLYDHFTREELINLYPTAKTYPVVVVDGWYVGGSEELAIQLENHVRNLESGQLLNEG